MKVCTVCGIEKDLIDFSKQKKTKDEYQTQCKSCASEKYEGKKERVAERKKKYYEANKERIAEQSKKYREANKELMAEYQKKYREANKELMADGKKYREAKEELSK